MLDLFNKDLFFYFIEIKESFFGLQLDTKFGSWYFLT